MPIQLIGVGVGRTGTASLKLALEQLLGGTCHHMFEVIKDQDQAPVWREAMLGTEPDWRDFLSDYSAIVDWPGAGVWRELAAAFPDAPVLLSTRSSPDVWWQSASETILKSGGNSPDSPMSSMISTMFERFTPDWSDADAAKAAYNAHNAAVRAEIPPERLFEYQPGDGWGPICAALGLTEPDEPFPHENSTADFKKRFRRSD